MRSDMVALPEINCENFTIVCKPNIVPLLYSGLLSKQKISQTRPNLNFKGSSFEE